MPLRVAPLVFPALSLTDAPADRSSPSPVTVLFAGAFPSMPDSASLADHVTVTSPLYQPLPFGAVVAAPLSSGSVLSTLTPVMLNRSLSLSAASVAVPPALWFSPSPTVLAAGQERTPESPSWSAQVNVAVTSDVNQPFSFARVDSAPVSVGLVLSTFTVVSSVAELPALSVAVPWTLCAAPSPLVTGSVQLAIPEPLSVQVNVTVTSLSFQLRMLAAGDCLWLMPGAVLSIF